MSQKLLFTRFKGGVTKKIHKQELWFLRSVRRPIKLNIRMKLREDILNGFQVRERTLFGDGQTDGRPWQKQCLPILKGEGHKNPNKVMCFA